MQQPRRGRSAALGSTHFWSEGAATGSLRDASTQTERQPFVAPPSQGPMPGLMTLRGRAPGGQVSIIVRTSVVAGQEEMLIVSREFVPSPETQRRAAMLETERRAERLETRRSAGGPGTQRALRGRPSATASDPLLVRPDDQLFQVGGPEDSQGTPI